MKKIGSRFRHSRYFLKKICALPLLAAALLSTALLSGCHGQREQAAFTVPEGFDTSKNYEITFWAKNDTNVRQTDIYKQAIADFQELYPNITVNPPALYGLAEKHLQRRESPTFPREPTPNVCITYPDHIATYLTGDNVVVPLDDLFSDPAYGLGGSEVLFDSPRSPRSSLSSWRNAGSAAIITRFPTCVPRRPAISIRIMWKLLAIPFRKP